MGFGKFLIGGLCAAGAIIAAPVVLPAAGWAIAMSPVTGVAGITAGTALATTSATTAAVVAGTAGTIVADAIESKHKQEESVRNENNAYYRGVNAGSEGKSEMKKAFDNERAEWKAADQEKEKIIQKKEELIKNQDEIIDALSS